MSQFTDKLAAGIKHVYWLQDDANQMTFHAMDCIKDACGLHSGLSWENKGRGGVLYANVAADHLCWWRRTYRRKVLTVFPNDAIPGNVRIVTHGAGTRGTDGGNCDSLVDCDERFAIDKQICQGICHFLALNTLVTS